VGYGLTVMTVGLITKIINVRGCWAAVHVLDWEHMCVGWNG
jgi:hypothetical protein